ncbi:DUF4279 domain-containing protein [Kordia sp.]|uniref:DUF4279 domain-containing protein n=1 Tax=Kordia sp. TaxID=1965332 RepID=UPI0025BBDF32|nr:DUF4279 domain-containing protein [Kordia sp.]MCH2196976.1 DUF4279 domain-containing protein [Kordia sp.]
MKSKIILRLSIESKDLESAQTIDRIKKKLPELARTMDIGSNGYRDFGNSIGIQPFPRKTSILFEYSYDDISLEKCNKDFLDNWKNLEYIFDYVKKYGYESYLNYEITIVNSSYPVIELSRQFISFIKDLDIEISFTFYNEDCNDIN